MTIVLKKFLLVAFLLPLMVVLSYAADAPEVDYIAPVNNYYAGMSVNFFSGDHTQDSGGNWSTNYVDQPLWSDEDASHGLNFGKYFGSAAEFRHAIEVGYISAFKTEDLVASNNSHVYNEYKNVFTLDYLHLRTLTDNMEYFGSIGIGIMENGGGQYYNNNSADDSASENETFMTFGGGLLYELNDNYDLKLTLKKYTNVETARELDLVGTSFTDRKFGFKDAYVTSASISYNY